MGANNPKAGDPYDLYDGQTVVKMIPVAAGVIPVKGGWLIIDTTTDPWTYKLATFGAAVRGKFAICVNVKTTDTGLKVECGIKGKFYSAFETNVQPHALCAYSSATNNRLETFVKSPIGGAFSEAELEAVQNDHSRIVGTYYGKPGEYAEGTESKTSVAGALGLINIGDYTGRSA